MKYNSFELYTNYRKTNHFYGFYLGTICNIQKTEH